ncbi:MAG: beta-lactamase family protein [Spirochaetes bacterium]|nr:beta-lactamase family protein [Spirochaetota bacterium]
MNRKFYTSLFIFFLIASVGCGQNPNETDTSSPVAPEGKILKNQLSDKKREELNQSILKLLNNSINHDGEAPIHNIALAVRSEKLGYEFIGAAGLADGKTETMTPDHKVFIASLTKTFTATIAMQLMEEGLLDLDKRMIDYLTDSSLNLDQLHIFDGKPYGKKIKVWHLLNHASGLADYLLVVPQNYRDRWTSKDIIDSMFHYKLNTKASFIPGTKFEYSNTNYILLGMIIEKITGESLGDLIEKRICKPLNLENTFLADGTRKLLPSYAFIFLGVQGSAPKGGDNLNYFWAAGGMYSTVADLSVFIEKLFSGSLFQKKNTLQTMISDSDRITQNRFDYGYGIFKFPGGYLGHNGASGIQMCYDPKHKIAFSLVINQQLKLDKLSPIKYDICYLLTGEDIRNAPLPEKITYKKPTGNVPSKIQNLLGKWEGDWGDEGRLNAYFIFEKVTQDSAEMVYGWGVSHKAGILQGGYERRTARLETNNDDLTVKFSSPRSTMIAGIEGTVSYDGKTINAVFAGISQIEMNKTESPDFELPEMVTKKTITLQSR